MTSCIRLLTLSSVLATVFTVASFALVSPDALGQSLSQSGSSGLNNHASQSMMYKERNFIGDRRAGDIHKDRRQITRDKWDIFRQSLRQTADQSASSAGSNQQQYSPTNGANMSGGTPQSPYGATSSGMTGVPSLHGSVLGQSPTTTTVSGASISGLEPPSGGTGSNVPGLVPSSFMSGTNVPGLVPSSFMSGTNIPGLLPSMNGANNPNLSTESVVSGAYNPSAETSTLVGGSGASNAEPAVAGYGTYTPGLQPCPTGTAACEQLNLDSDTPISSYGH